MARTPAMATAGEVLGAAGGVNQATGGVTACRRPRKARLAAVSWRAVGRVDHASPRDDEGRPSKVRRVRARSKRGLVTRPV